AASSAATSAAKSSRMRSISVAMLFCDRCTSSGNARDRISNDESIASAATARMIETTVRFMAARSTYVETGTVGNARDSCSDRLHITEPLSSATCDYVQRRTAEAAGGGLAAALQRRRAIRYHGPP